MLILNQLLYQKSFPLIFLTFFNKKLLKFVIYAATVKAVISIVPYQDQGEGHFKWLIFAFF